MSIDKGRAVVYNYILKCLPRKARHFSTEIDTFRADDIIYI
jgi:hypothetical protein